MSFSNGTINHGLITGGGSNSNAFAVTVATTTNIDLSVAPANIDGLLLFAGNTILVKDETPDTGNGNPTNGIYLFQAVGQPLVRFSSFVLWGAYVRLIVSVGFGSQAGSSWVSSAVTGGVLGTTNLAFADSSAGGVTVTGGITKNGNNLTLTVTTAPTNQFAIGVAGTTGSASIVYAQPQFSNIANTIDLTQLPNNGVNGNSQLIQTNATGQYPPLDASLETISSFTLQNTAVIATDNLSTITGKLQGQINNQAGSTITITTNTTLTANNSIILVDLSSNDVQITLPLISTMPANITTKLFKIYVIAINQTVAKNLSFAVQSPNTLLNSGYTTKNLGDTIYMQQLTDTVWIRET